MNARSYSVALLTLTSLLADPATASAASPCPSPKPDPFRELCPSTATPLECARAIEAVQLPKFPGVERNDRLLQVRLTSGVRNTLLDGGEDGVAKISYSFREKLGRFYVFQVLTSDKSSYAMIDETTGSQFPLVGAPRLSPDGQRVLVASADLEGKDGLKVLQVWRVIPKSLTPEWAVKPTEWGPTSPQWVGNDRICFQQTIARDGGYTHTPTSAQLRDGKWQIVATAAPKSVPQVK